MKIIITGTPGTGKTTIAGELGKLIGCEALEVNKLVKTRRLYSKIEKGEMVADFGKLKKALTGLLKANEAIILESHLLSDLKLPADLVLVIRCNPFALKKRLAKRKYAISKINENVLCEALDYCYINALENYGGGKVVQIDATPKLSANAVLAKINTFKKTRKSPAIRWLPKMSARELLGLGI